jgi:hypothetical protein
MTGLDTTGWTVEGHPEVDPASFWRVLKGSAAADPAQAMIVRASLEALSANDG